MGWLIETVLMVAYAVVVLIVGLIAAGVAFAVFGHWVAPLLLLGGLIYWFHDRLKSTIPGAFWRNLNGQVGAWSAKLPSPTAPENAFFNQENTLPLLPAHLLALHADLRPNLVSLYRALHSPDSLRVDAVDEDIAGLLALYLSAQQAVFDAGGHLKRQVFEPPDCPEADRLAVASEFAAAMKELTRVYGTVLSHLAENPHAPDRIRLEHNLRANLERLAMWLADILLALAEPQRILRDGDAVGDSGMGMTFTLYLAYPESVADLKNWADTPTGYDAGHIRTALVG